MPYVSINSAKDNGFPTHAEGAPMTLAQINKLAEIYDAVKNKPGIKNAIAIAWTQWKKLYKKVGNKWVKIKKKELSEYKKRTFQNSVTKTEENKGDWIVWGYASTFDVDTGNDQITKDALLGAKNDFVKYSTVLFNHDSNRPIGKVIDTEVDDKGLLIKVILSKTEKDIWTKVTEGIISKWSISGRVIEEEQISNGVYQINKIKFVEVSLVSVPANNEAVAVDAYTSKNQNMNILEKLKDIAGTRTAREIKEGIQNLVDSLEEETIEKSPIADVLEEWSASEKNEIAIYASSDGSGNNDTIDWSKYQEAFAWCDPNNTKSIDGYKLQHHTVKDGNLVVVWQGVAKAMTELLGIKGKTNIPAEEIDATYNHLAQHYKQFDKKVPEKKVSYELLEDEDDAIIGNLQVLAGKLSDEEKEIIENAIKFMQTTKEETLSDEIHTYNFDDVSENRPIYQLNSTTNIELKDGDTFRKQVLKFGKWYHWDAEKGVLEITKDLVGKIVDNFKEKVIENVSVPLTHTNDPSKNTGNVVDLIQTDKGLDAIIEVKDKTIAKKIKDGLIKCVSASIDPNYLVKTSNKFVGPTMLHAALVQEPYIKGMQGFIPLSEDFVGRPVLQFEDTALSLKEEITNIKNKLIELSMEINKEDEISTEEKKEDPIVDDTEKKEDETEEKKEDIKEDEKVDTETPEEVSDEEINKSLDASLNECIKKMVDDGKDEDIVKSEYEKNIDKSKYADCMKKQLKAGKKFAEAVKTCKAEMAKQLSDSSLEVKKSKEDEDVQSDAKVDLAEAQNTYEEYLKQGKIIPAQKEAFIKLFASKKALDFSDDKKVDLHEVMKNFLDAQPKIVDFEEKGTDVNDSAPVNKTSGEMPEDAKSFFKDKLGLSDEDAKESWTHAQELKKEEDEMKETIF